MKALVLVDGVNQVPASIRTKLYVISAGNWEEAFQFLAGKTESQYLYFHDTAPTERLLKLVEEYPGDLAVYTAQSTTNVLLSRFTRVLNRRSISISEADLAKFNADSENAKLLKQIKSFLY